jgi:hypothetical protein
MGYERPRTIIVNGLFFAWGGLGFEFGSTPVAPIALRSATVMTATKIVKTHL